MPHGARRDLTPIIPGGTDNPLRDALLRVQDRIVGDDLGGESGLGV
jgi:hypothetical protein